MLDSEDLDYKVSEKALFLLILSLSEVLQFPEKAPTRAPQNFAKVRLKL